MVYIWYHTTKNLLSQSHLALANQIMYNIQMTQSEKYKLLVKWMAIPEESKIAQNLPRSIDQLRERYNISLKDLNSFFEMESFPDDVEREAIRWGKRKIPELIHIVYKKYIETKKPEHLRLFKELLSIKEENQSQNQYNFFNLDEKAKEQLTKRILARRRARLLSDSSGK